MKKKVVLHAHNYGHKNIGDEAMAQNVYNKLIDRGFDVYTISTYGPPEGQNKLKDRVSVSGFVNNYNNSFIKIFLVLVNKLRLRVVYSLYVKSVVSVILSLAKLYKLNIKFSWLFPKLYELLKSFEHADIYIRSGSGSLNDIWFWSSFIPQLTEAKLAKFFDTKVCFTGQGIGPITGKYREDCMREFVSSVDLMTLRDASESKEFLDTIGCNTLGEYSVVGDDALDLPKELFLNFSFGSEKYIICQFRETDYVNKINSTCWDKLANEIDKIVIDHPSIKIVFISFSNGKINDLSIAQHVDQLCMSEIYIIEKVLTSEEAKGVISNAEVAIGQSYHFGVFALSESVPFIGMYTNQYYKSKHSGLLEWYGMQDYLVDMNEELSISKKVDNLISTRNNYIDGMKQINKDMVVNINRIFDGL